MEKGKINYNVSFELDNTAIMSWILGHWVSVEDSDVIYDVLRTLFGKVKADGLRYALCVINPKYSCPRLTPTLLANRLLEHIESGKWAKYSVNKEIPEGLQVNTKSNSKPLSDKKAPIRNAHDLQRHTAILINPDVIKFVEVDGGRLGVLSTDERTVMRCGLDGTYRVLNALRYKDAKRSEFGLLRVLANSIKYGDVILADLEVKNDRAAYVMRYGEDLFCSSTDGNDVISLKIPISEMATTEVFKVVKLQKL